MGDWQFEFRRNFDETGSAVLWTNLIELPPKISQITVRIQDTVPQTGTIIRDTYCFKKDDMEWGWPSEELLTEDIKNISHFTFNTEITLISVYDSDGNNVTEKYNQKNETNFIEQKSQSHDIRLDALSTKMDKLMKEMNKMQCTLNDINDLQKQIDKISKKLLLNGNHKGGDMDKDKH